MPTAAEIDWNGVEQIANAVMAGGYVLKDFTAVTDDEMEALYAYAYHLLDQGQLAKAEQSFEFLCQLDHYAGRFWLGLGASRQLQGEHARAIQAYAAAGVHDLENPVPALRAAECYAALGQWKEAESGAKAAAYWSSRKPEYAPLKARADVLLDGLKQRKET